MSNGYLETIPSRVGEYILVREIGRGSSSIIYLAVKQDTNEKVAIKIVSRKFLIDRNAVENFQREVTAFSKMNHRNIVRFYEIQSDDNLIYIIMEYCRNGNLQMLASQPGGMSERTAKPIVHQIGSAISYFHSLGIAHRDIKLENIFLNQLNEVKVGDFGFCREQTKENELFKTQCGSPIYAPPEIVDNKQYDGKKADMWSTGVVIYSLVTGTVPWKDCKNIQNLFRDIQMSRYHVPDQYSAEFKSLIHSLMHPLPEMRLSAAKMLSHPWLAGDIHKVRDMTQSFASQGMDMRGNAGMKMAAPMAMRFKMVPGGPKRPAADTQPLDEPPAASDQ